MTFDSVKELFGFWKTDHKSETPTQAVDNNLHQEAVKAWNKVDPHPADKKIIDNNLLVEKDSRDIANKRAELNQIQQSTTENSVLKPVSSVPNEIMEKYSTPLPQVEKAA